MKNDSEEKLKISLRFRENVSEEQEQAIWDSLFDILLAEVDTAEKTKTPTPGVVGKASLQASACRG